LPNGRTTFSLYQPWTPPVLGEMTHSSAASVCSSRVNVQESQGACAIMSILRRDRMFVSKIRADTCAGQRLAFHAPTVAIRKKRRCHEMRPCSLSELSSEPPAPKGCNVLC